MTTSPSQSSGFSLIEVVVTMFIMAVGFIGMAGLQTTSTKNGLDTAHLSQTTPMSEEIVERMRANVEAITGVADNGYTTISSTVLTCNATPAKRCANNAAGDAEACTANELAEYEVWEVFCGQGDTGDDDVIANSQDSLALTAVSITCDEADQANCDESSTYTVSISWESLAVLNDKAILEEGNVDEQRIRTATFSNLRL